MTEEEAVRLCNTCTAPASCSEFGRCPLDFPDAFNAHASDFPEGTRLVVTAQIELPSQEG